MHFQSQRHSDNEVRGRSDRFAKSMEQGQLNAIKYYSPNGEASVKETGCVLSKNMAYDTPTANSSKCEDLFVLVTSCLFTDHASRC